MLLLSVLVVAKGGVRAFISKVALVCVCFRSSTELSQERIATIPPCIYLL
jgi:hypothetical protein